MNRQIEVPTYKYIVDMDGTLYNFGGKQGQSFGASEFYGRIKSNAYDFFQKRLGVSQGRAMEIYKNIKEKYQGEISIGVEKEFGIDRYDYFNSTWDIDPAEFITTDQDVRAALEILKGRMALLTAAPRIWTLRVLACLNIDDLFNTIYTGEPNLRKPNPDVFATIANLLGSRLNETVSIGDQEESDILPPKSIGMKTIRVGNERGQADYNILTIGGLVPLLEKEKLL